MHATKNLFLLLLFICESIASHIHENANACVDGCHAEFQTQFKINLTSGEFEAEDLHLVQIYQQDKQEDAINDAKCSKNVLLRVPFNELNEKTIVKIELLMGDYHQEGLFQIGSGENEFFLQVANNSLELNGSLCGKKSILLNKTENAFEPKSEMVIYIANKWIRIDNDKRNSSDFYTHEKIFNYFPSFSNESCEFDGRTYSHSTPEYLYISLNRLFNDSSTFSSGEGVCAAEISFIKCDYEDEPDMQVNVDSLEYKETLNSSVSWIHKLDFLEPSIDHLPCSAEGVLRLNFDPMGTRKIARFDLTFGDKLNGFTFNIGDSPSNNGYGGDSGSTSNSAEVHSNDNRFYTWLNPKYCGDTLLHRIEYGVFKPNDTITIFVSDQRLEITNNRNFHQVMQNPYLFNLNRQNVTCNCFDARCYPGVETDDDLYLGINRVIGGTYRPGNGLCKAKINWLHCRTNIRNKFLNANPKVMTGSILAQTSTPIVATETSEEITSTMSNTQKMTNTAQLETQTVNLTTNVMTTLIDTTRIDVSTNRELANSTLTTEITSSIEFISRAIFDLCKNRTNKHTEMYFEYPYDDTKFIYCNKLSQLSVLPCPFNMKWSQYYQQCLQVSTPSHTEAILPIQTAATSTNKTNA